MNDLLANVPRHDVLLIGILIGVWWTQLGRRDQGRRIGQLEKLVAVLTGKHLTQGRDRPKLDPP